MAVADVASAGAEEVPDRIYRHSGLTRATHWINAITLFVLLLSGLNIFMAEPGLFIGQYADFDHPAVRIFAAHAADGHLVGVTQIGNSQITTTGFLGVSNSATGHPVARTWPTWMTLPSYRDLATARRWHFFFAWVLVINGAAYLAWNTYVRHIQKDLWLTRQDIAEIPQSVVDHALLRHPTGLAATRSSEWLALAGLTALMASGFLLLARLARLGFLSNFLSRTVLVGFLSGVGLQVAVGEVSGILGLPGGGQGTVRKMVTVLGQLRQIQAVDLGIALSVVLVIVGSRWISRQVPGALIAVAGAILASRVFHLDAHGVQLLGSIPSGLPRIGLPAVHLSIGLVERLFPTAFAMFVVILGPAAIKVMSMQ